MIFFIAVILCTLLPTTAAAGESVEPTSEEVIIQLNKLLEERSKEGASYSKFLVYDDSEMTVKEQPEREWFNFSLPVSSKYFFLGVFLIGIIIILYYLISSPVVRGSGDQSPGSPQAKLHQKSEEGGKRFDYFYNIARSLYQKNNFAGTVLNLHKATVEYIHFNKIRHKKLSYTNGELKGFISGNGKLLDAFIKIAKEAESILFGKVPTSKDRCAILVQYFEDNFTGK